MSEAPNPAMLTLARESRGMTQTDLAGVSGISQGYISKVENGMLTMSAEKAAVVAKALLYDPKLFYCDDVVHGIDALFHRRLKTVPVTTLRQIQAEINLDRKSVV